MSLESSREQISEAFSGDTQLYEEFTLKLKLWIITLEGKTRKMAKASISLTRYQLGDIML